MLIRQNRILRPFVFRSRSHALVLLIVCACAAVVLASFSQRKADDKNYAQADAASIDDEVDLQLERAAREALSSEDGTIIVMDPQSGRLRAVVNPQAAFTEAYAPGSAIKPFTALSALRLHLIDDRTRQLCHTRYTYKDLAISCPHQKTDVSFNLTQALAYSCNYFFGKVGERLDTNTFDETLGSFGFGAQTGINDALIEATGSLPQGEWRVSNALGESKQLMVTPVQLITAYSALVNGGHLFTPQQAKFDNFQTQERARLTIAPEHRALLIEGMRGAVRYGTAASAELGTLPFDVFGKTGTSAMMNDYRSQGWFIGFASQAGLAEGTPPESIKLAVLVFLKHSSGAEAARVARSVFEEYAKRRGNVEDKKLASENLMRQGAPDRLSDAPVRIHLTGQNITKDVSLEEYVLGVVTAEGSIEDELEALKALAVVSRTFALKNLQRHANEGYDFCDTTHCQRYRFTITDERNHARFKNLLKRAVNETAGETLRDEEGQIADAYFHAACGGMTANMETLWGAQAPAYLKGVSDEYCAAAQHTWVNVIPVEKLARALQGDLRSDVGSRLENITITSLDQTGRVEFLALEGEKRRVVRGWDFKMIVGRALGWNILKSSRFDVTHIGTNFVFRGSGFGHGLGLCQEGAHALAQRGTSYRQILNHYFPGTSIGSNIR
jgi:stage II sporulation protein D